MHEHVEVWWLGISLLETLESQHCGRGGFLGSYVIVVDYYRGATVGIALVLAGRWP